MLGNDPGIVYVWCTQYLWYIDFRTEAKSRKSKTGPKSAVKVAPDGKGEIVG